MDWTDYIEGSMGEVPDYYTGKRVVSLYLLGTMYKTLSYRSFLARHAQHTITEIQNGNFETDDQLGVLQERNLIRVLTTNIVTETIGILEMLAALSIDANGAPEDRAMNIMTYRSWQADEFYSDLNHETELEEFKNIFSYPNVSDLDVSPDDMPYYESVLDSNAESYKDFYLVAKSTWDLLKPVRNKATHGFPLLMYDNVRPTAPTLQSLPEGSDDILISFNNSSNTNVYFDGLVIGDEPRDAYLTVARNSVMIQGDLITGLSERLRNRGNAVFPSTVFGKVEILDHEPETAPSYKLDNIEESIRTEGMAEEIDKQSEYLDLVVALSEKHGID